MLPWCVFDSDSVARLFSFLLDLLKLRARSSSRLGRRTLSSLPVIRSQVIFHSSSDLFESESGSATDSEVARFSGDQSRFRFGSDTVLVLVLVHPAHTDLDRVYCYRRFLLVDSGFCLSLRCVVEAASASPGSLADVCHLLTPVGNRKRTEISHFLLRCCVRVASTRIIR